MSSPTEIHNSPDIANYSRPFSESKRADINISNQDVSGLNTDEQILYELRQLNRLYRLQAELAREEPLKSQALWNFLLQAFGLIAGTLFGVFAILAWKAATQANSMAIDANTLASAANRIALVGYCQSQTDDVCSSIVSAASSSIYSYASSYYSIIPGTSEPTTTPSATSVSTGSGSTTVTSSSSGLGSAQPTSTTTYTSASAAPTSAPSESSSGALSKRNIGAIVGGVIGGIAGLLLIGYLPWLTFRSRKKRYEDIAPLAEAQQYYGR